MEEKDIRILGYWEIGILGYWVTGILGDLEIGTSKWRNSSGVRQFQEKSNSKF